MFSDDCFGSAIYTHFLEACLLFFRHSLGFLNQDLYGILGVDMFAFYIDFSADNFHHIIEISILYSLGAFLFISFLRLVLLILLQFFHKALEF